MYLSIKMNILLLMLLAICEIYTAYQLPDPCAGIFKYVPDDNRIYHGEITIKYPPKYESSCLQVTFVFFNLRITVYESGLTLQSKQPIIINGEPSFVYRIYFDNYYPTMPVIKEIKFNNIVMCDMKYELPESTRIIMSHCLYPPGVNFISNASSENPAEKHQMHRQYFNEVIDVSKTYVVLSKNLKAPLLKKQLEDDGLPPITFDL
ncbi:uncharacterized protein LOC122860884 [Aphidius gifuensis]|uniref:uncharacterized protein LOC122860884 n=1 Tax=Aphidius gifuensis TaxID=684658 RepID=UPI001CDD2600|nr:uncharacterized protein LOC122860884 [Aphidius gifuensis]